MDQREIGCEDVNYCIFLEECLSAGHGIKIASAVDIVL
jgi:hypothetical protein